MAVIERTKRLNVVLSEEEHAMVVALAALHGQGISDWTRQMIRGAARRAKLGKKPPKQASAQPSRAKKTTKKRKKRA